MAEERPLLHDRYRVVGKLGRGAFATVYLADDLRMGRPVAIKVVEDAVDVDGRALREAQAAAKLDHPHIVTIHEVVRESDRTLLFTEYVEGQTLRQLYARRQLTDSQLVEAGIQMCRALEHAHRRGVVHRDIKPENVMLVDCEDVDVRVMDFGVAQLEDMNSVTLDGDLVGTLAYMAPEQLEGRNVDAKADVYALSLTLYEGFTGINPLRGQTPAELLRGASRMVFTRLNRTRPELPEVLDEALHLGLENDPALRLNAAGLRRMLEQAGKRMPVPVETPTLATRVEEVLRFEGKEERLAFFARHLMAGLFTLAAIGYLVPHLGFYPRGWVLPLICLVPFLSLLLPAAGGVAAVLLLAPPVFAFGAGWGLLYLPLAALVFLALRWSRREWAVMLPLAVPLFASWGPIGLGLVLTFPVLCGLTWRRWGLLGGLLTGLALALSAGFLGWDSLPFTFSAGGQAVLLATRHVASPFAALDALSQLLVARPELLLQSVLFLVLAAPLGRLFRGAYRWWALTVQLSCLFALLVILPPLVVHAAVDLVRLAVPFVVCAILTALLAFLSAMGGPGSLAKG